MKNFVNWMCLFSIMVLVLQVMVHINKEAILELNKKNKKVRRSKNVNIGIGNTTVEEKYNYYQRKIAK